MATDPNLAAVLRGVGNLRVEERPIPEPGPGDTAPSQAETRR